jgi:hypothetical protein
VSGKEKNNIYRYNDMRNRMNCERGSTSDGSLEKRVVFGLLEDVESNKEVVAKRGRSINRRCWLSWRIEGGRE